MNFSGYVLAGELAKKADVSLGAFYCTNKREFLDHMGGTAVIDTFKLPDKYKSLSEKCIDLGKYWTVNFFENTIGLSKSYLYNTNWVLRQKNKKERFEFVKVGGRTMIELPDDFVENIKNGRTPIYIGRSGDINDFDSVVEVQGLKVGFY